MKKRKFIAFMLTIMLLSGSFPISTAFAAQGAVSGNTVTVTIHYHKDNGDYSKSNIKVWNFAGKSAAQTSSTNDAFGLVMTFSVDAANYNDYIKFQIASDSVFPTDKRYLDPAGNDSVEAWFIDGDARAYAKPVLVPEADTMAKDGTRYVAIQTLPTTLAGTGAANDFKIKYGKNGYTWIDQNGVHHASNSYDILTLYRNAVGGTYDANGVWTSGAITRQDDWFEICPAAGNMAVDSLSIQVVSGVNNGPYGSPGVLNGDMYPSFLPIQVIQSGSVAPGGKTFASLATIERIAQVGTLVMGKDTYLMPTQFVAYDKVQDDTSNPAAMAAVGFDPSKIAVLNQFIKDQSTESDGMAIGLVVSKNGKTVYKQTYGDALKYSTTPDGNGGYIPATLLPSDQRIPVTQDSMFDLASNTKMYATNYAIERLVSEGKLDIDTKLSELTITDPKTGKTSKPWANFKDSYVEYTGKWTLGGGLPNTPVTGKQDVTIREILSHYSGQIPDPEYPNRVSAGDLWYQSSDTTNRAGIIDKICKTPLEWAPGTSYHYSDVDYMVLGLIVEQITGESLDTYLENIYKNDLGLTHTMFNPKAKGVTDVVATELNGNTRDGWVSFGYLDDGITPVPIRKYTLQGQVHDEKAWYSMGGVSGHAGLFSNLSDMSALTQLALNNGVYNGFEMFGSDVHKLFTSPFLNNGKLTTNSVGLGWWMNDSSSSRQSYFQWGPSEGGTYGHQGWTGTLTVIDPVYDMTITLLTNRIDSPIVNGSPTNYNTFANSDYPILGINNYNGPGAYYLQNAFAYAALDTTDHNTRSWSVTFNGGDAAAQTVLDGNYVTEPIRPVKDGYVFDGWYSDDTLTTPWDFVNNPVMSDVTLYAKWTPASDGSPASAWNVIFNTNGGSPVATQQVADNGSAVLPTAPIKQGYQFSGWYTDPSLSNSWDPASSVVKADTVIYAKWTPVWTVTFNTNGGSYVASQKVNDGERAIMPTATPKKMAGGGIPNSQTFEGWYTDNGTFKNQWDPSVPITSDITLYAKWSMIWSVKEIINNGTTSPSIAVPDGQVAVKPSDPTRDNSQFMGWYTNLGFTDEYKFDSSVTTNETIYAKWLTDLTGATVIMHDPLIGALPQKGVTDKGYTGTIAWYNVTDNKALTSNDRFEPLKQYKATISMTSAPNYRWTLSPLPVITVAGQTVENTAVSGAYDSGNTLVCEVTYAPLTTLGPATINIKAPVYRAVPQGTIADGLGYTGTITWYNASGEQLTGTFGSQKAYSAHVVLTSDSGCNWPVNAPAITVPGQVVSNVVISGGTSAGNALEFDVVFPATAAANSGSAGDTAGGSTGGVTPPSDDQNPAAITRLSGDDRYETCVKAVDETWKTSDYAVLVTGEDYPDALSAAPLAKKYNAPILITQSQSLTPVIEKEIAKLNVKNLFIIGGNGAVSNDIQNLLTTKYNINCVRISGIDRYETSANIANYLDASNGAVIASGNSYADALSIASYAAAKGMPILLADKDSIPSSVSKYITDNKVTRTYIVGGEGVIGKDVENLLPNPTRYAGDDRYGTNVKVINSLSNEFKFDTVYITTGEDFADALSGAVLAANSNSPIILVSDNMLPESTKAIKEILPMAKTKCILGGEGAVSTDMLNNLLQ